MDKSLITTRQNQVQTTPDHVGQMSALPIWLRKLIGAYPKSWANEMTYALLDTRFSGYGNQVMGMAVDSYIDENNEFPTIANLKPYVLRFAPKDALSSFIQSMLKAGYEFQSDNDNTMTFIEVSTGNEVQIRH